jgi:selenocysteine lyase/cysteine desulfurase
MLKSVERAGIKGILGKRNPAGISAEDFFTSGEKIRIGFSRVIRNKNPQRIVIIPSVSYGIANVVHNLKLSSQDNLVIAGEQFPSNFYPWQRLSQESGASLKTVTAPDVSINRGKLWNERILEAIDKDTKVVAIGNVHWADGTLFDLKAMRQRTRDVGALLIVDGTQSVGALPFDIQAIDPDALICGGYKWLLGPYSIGMAYYGEYFDGGKPIEENWINRKDSEDFAGLVNYRQAYQEGALRYEVGEHSNFILAPMMLEALKQISEWNPKNIQAYCKSINTEAIDLLSRNGFWIEEAGMRGEHLFGVRLPKGTDIKKVKHRIRENKISVSFRGTAVRVAPHVYNRKADLLKLAQVLIA